MYQQLGEKTLEQYPEWRLDLTAAMRLDKLAIAATSITKGNVMDYVGRWVFLRTEVLDGPKLE